MGQRVQASRCCLKVSGMTSAGIGARVATALAAKAGGIEGSLACISAARAGAVRISSGMRRASGRFFQYFFGISERIASGISRAGLKMLA